MCAVSELTRHGRRKAITGDRPCQYAGSPETTRQTLALSGRLLAACGESDVSTESGEAPG